MRRVRIELYGLSCAGCVSAVRTALEKAGAKVIRIDLSEAEIEVGDEDVQKYLQAVKMAGYGARVKE
jgi:copper chaperone CopZ